MSYDSDKRWLDGPGLVEWFEQDVPIDTSAWTESDRDRIAQTLNRWRGGGRADLYVVDELLIRLGHHPIEIPDELYLSAKRAYRKAEDYKARKAAALRMLTGGSKPMEVVRALSISLKTVYNWRQEAGLA